ncbi:MAG: aminotransferase class V-fold PLP-dependent enzyme [Cyclobacteriaceae bacterium]
MNNRRDFIRKAALGSAALPLTSALSAESTYLSLDQLKGHLDRTVDDSTFWATIRKQFPLKEGQTYFNNGTMGPQPSYVLERVIEDMRYNAVHGAETDYKGEGPQLLSGYFQYQDLRTKLGGLINADYKEISLTQNATFGMNFIANGLDLKEGDEIINTDQEHGGGYAAWKQLAKRKGLVYKQAVLPVPANDPQEIIDSVLAQITKKTRVIAVPHLVSVYGVIMPVKEICAEARKRGIFTILDGAQTVGQINVDVKDIDCDAYYASLHKWLLAPGGNGILYVKSDQVDKVWCTLASYNWENYEDHGFRLQQYGTGNPSLLVGLDAAVDFYNTVGAEKWLLRVKELGDYLRAGLKDVNKVTIHSSVHPEMCAGLTTYAVEGITGPALQKKLWEEKRLQPRSVGEELLRHSVHIYNNESEIDQALEVIRSI